MQVINDPYARGTGAEAGGQLGNTLNMALNILAQEKLKGFAYRSEQKRQREQQAEQEKLLEQLNLPGVSPKMAYLNPQNLGLYQKQQQLQQTNALRQQLQEHDFAREQVQDQYRQQQLGQKIKHEEDVMKFREQAAKEDREYREKKLALSKIQQQGKAELDLENKRSLMQKRIDDKNTPYLKSLEDRKVKNQEHYDVLKDMIADLESGKVYSGITGYIPFFGQNDETQDYFSKGEKLAMLSARDYGRGTKFATEAARLTKPTLFQKPKVQMKIAKDLLKISMQPMIETKIKDLLIEENGGMQPANLNTLAHKYVQKYGDRPDLLGFKEFAKSEDEWESEADIPFGTIFEDAVSGEKKIKLLSGIKKYTGEENGTV